MKKNKLLFILKRRPDFNLNAQTPIGLTTGLYNSASFMSEMMNEMGIESKMVVVNDNNDIDREVSKFKPTHVIIEALWVVPSKFNILTKIHPKVQWIVRLHSEVPFLSNEGMALDWIADYCRFENVIVAANSPKSFEDIKVYVRSALDLNKYDLSNKIIYLPNYYPQEYKTKNLNKDKEYIDISCFGAVRPLKNHLNQAIAAIKFAEFIGKKLKFHINIGRVEMKGEPVLNNLISMFYQISDQGHLLVKHEWAVREEFLKICSKMDIGMQVSFSETFNIVAADLITQGVPIVTSKELPWVSRIFTAKPTSVWSIFINLWITYNFSKLNLKLNQYLLKNYTNETRKIWKKYFR